MAILNFLFAFVAMAQTSTSLLQGPPTGVAKLNELVTYHAREHYHFNSKAPQSCGAGPARDLKAEELKCQFTISGSQKVNLKICDDKETFCKNEEFLVQVSGPSVLPQKPASNRASVKINEMGLPGFLMNVPDEALERAKHEDKLLFIDFYGSWCPPCRIMEDTVLNDEKFLKVSEGMVRVSLDTDRQTSWQWESLFHPSGYPTYVITDSQLREIGRWEGSANLTAFVAWLGQQQKWKDQPLAVAKANVQALNDDGRRRVAEAYLAEEKGKEALEVLKGLKGRAFDHLRMIARLKIAKSENQGKDLRVALYKEAIAQFDGHDGQVAQSGVMDWIPQLYALDKDAAKPFLDGFDGILARLKSSPDVISEGYILPNIFETMGMGFFEAGDKELGKKFSSRCADAFAEMITPSKNQKPPKGLSMSRGKCLSAAERYADVAELYTSLSKAYPQEYTFHRSLARALYELKKFPEALREADLAEKSAYGDIWLFVMSLKADIQVAMHRNSQAKKTLQTALARIELPVDSGLSTHRSYQALKDQLAKIQ